MTNNRSDSAAANLADLEDRLSRFRSRMAAEGRAHALAAIDRAIERAKSDDVEGKLK